MSSLQFLNTKADILRRSQALAVNINAAKGLQEVLKTNLGPKGTMKMYAYFLILVNKLGSLVAPVK